MKKNKFSASKDSGASINKYNYDDIDEMLDSGLDDSEIAKELGISPNELYTIEREIYND